MEKQFRLVEARFNSEKLTKLWKTLNVRGYMEKSETFFSVLSLFSLFKVVNFKGWNFLPVFVVLFLLFGSAFFKICLVHARAR